MRKKTINVVLPVCALISISGCDYSNTGDSSQLSLAAKVAIDQSAAMETELQSSAGLYQKVWNSEFQTRLADLPAQGKAKRVPSSGHWYPEQAGGLNSTDVLRKYDRAYNANGNKAFDWELRNRTSGISWAGHCNGFAAAAIRHREPLRSVYKNGVEFTRQDIKALMAGIHMSAGFQFLGGTRCERSLTNSNPDGNMNACDDINPGLFHSVLANWVGAQQQAIIFDKSGDSQVWNYPLFQYSSTLSQVSESKASSIVGGSGSNYRPNPNAVDFMDVRTVITYADAVNGYEVLDYLQEGRVSYRYILELDGAGNIIGGEWAVESQREHPDFVWIPLEPKRGSGTKDGGNPNLDPQEILQLWAESRGLSSPSEEPPPYDLYTYDSNWGNFSFYQVKLDNGKTGTSFSNVTSKLHVESNSTLIASGDDKLEVYMDDRLIALPKINLSTEVEFLAPVDPGINRLSLIWKTATYNNSNEPHRIYYYSMD